MSATADVTLTSPGYDYNMSGWALEKADGVIRGIAEAIDVARRMVGADETRDQLLSALYGAAWDATKVMTTLAGVGWDVSDANDVRDNGTAGYLRLAKRCGTIARGEDPEAAWKCLCSQLLPLLNGTRGESRTKVYDLLGPGLVVPKGFEDRVKTLREDIENVTNGEFDWEEFVRDARLLLAMPLRPY